MEPSEFSRSSLARAINLHGRQLNSLHRALEKRVLLDASVAADVSQSATAHTDADDTATAVAHQDNEKKSSDSEKNTAETLAPETAQRQELVIIDLQLDRAQELVDDLLQQATQIEQGDNSLHLTIGERSVTLLALDIDDGLNTITGFIQQSGQIFDAIHLISHGGAGGIDVGGEELSLTSLTAPGDNSHAAQLQSWANSLSENADILLYGCNTGYSLTGEKFISQIASLTGADVAASDDATGSALRGGDWELERTKGEVETDIVFSQLLQGTWEALMVATPNATVDAPAEDFINEDTDIGFSFENDGDTTGYGPFMDIVVGPGLNLDLAGAVVVEYTYEGGQWLDGNDNPVEYHPYDFNQTGLIPLPPGEEGATWYAIQLPFGSYSPDQPSFDFNVSAFINAAEGALVGVPIPIWVRPGFAYGNDPLNNPDTDPPVLGGAIETEITPTVIKVDKVALDGDEDNDSIGDDGETVTGPSEPVIWQVTVDIANLSTIENLVVTEQVPNNFYYLPTDLDPENVTVTVGGVLLEEGTDYILTEPPEGANNDAQLIIEFIGAIAGTEDANEVVITYTGYVPDVDANGNPIVINDGADDVVRNTASATGDYQGQTVSDEDDAIIVAVASALQKDVAIIDPVGDTDYTPGDTLEYTLTLQVSDYMDLANLVLTDSVGDGLQVDPDSITFTLFLNGATINEEAFGAGNATVTENADGSTTISLNLSQELIDRAISDGSLIGDLFADANTEGTTTITIKYQATIRETYLATGAPVNIYDVINNDATINGTAENAGGAEIDNESNESIQIAGATSEKSVYAVDGSTDIDESPTAAVGQTVTFAIEIDLSTLDHNGLVITDFLPQPVFDAIAPTFTDTAGGTLIPGVNQWGFGPTTEFDNWPDGYLDGLNVTTSADTGNNSITWNFDPVNQDGSAGGIVQLLFTVQVQDQPFTDGLFLTNVAQVSINGTDGTVTLPPVQDQIEVVSPDVNLTKGVVSTSNDGGIFDPTPPGPVGFTDIDDPTIPGTPPWTGSITSDNLDTAPIDSNLSGVDAGDTVRFAIVLENTGGSDAFNLVISDTLPEGFEIPPGGINLQIYTGNGDLVNFLGNPEDLFTTGITLVDPSADEGALNQGRDADTGDTTADGSNVIVITYDLIATDSVQPGQEIVNTAQLEGYGGVDEGNDYTEGNTDIDWQDDATVTILDNAVDKALVETSINSDNNANNEAVIGETITYSLTLTIAEGVTPLASVADTLDNGLVFLDIVSVTSSSGDIQNDSGAPWSQSDLGVTTNGQQVIFDLGNLNNINRDNGTPETITIQYRVLVANVVENQSGDQLNNNAQFIWDSTHDGVDNPTVNDTDSAEVVTVIEPDLQVEKTLTNTPQPIDAGDTIQYTIVISHTGFSDTDAFDVTFTDTLPPELVLESFSFVLTVNDVPVDPPLPADLFQVVGNTISTAPGASFDLPLDGELTLVINARVVDDVVVGSVISNTGTADWQSIDGDDANERTGEDGAGGELNDYETDGSFQFTVANVEAGKSILSSSVENEFNGVTEAVIGETVTYQASFSVPEGVVINAQILDTLPAGLEFVSLDDVIFGDDLLVSPPDAFENPIVTVNDDGTTSIDFGTANVANIGDDNEPDLITLVYTVRVTNVETNQAGTLLTNNAQFISDTGTTEASTTVTVIEPQLTIDKSASVTTGDNGDEVTYTITVTNPAEGSTTAYDIFFTDFLPDEFSFTGFDATLTSPGTPPPEPTNIRGNFIFDAATNELRLNPQNTLDLVPGSSVTITITGTLINTVAGSDIINDTDLRWTSLNGDDANERTGDDGEGGELDDYAVSDDAVITVNAPTIEKTLVETSQNDSLNDDTEATIGEIVTFSVTVTLPEATLIGEITDNYGPGFEFLDLVSVTASNPGAIVIDQDAITVINDPANNLVGFDFGTLINTDTDSTTAETVTFTYRVRVADIPENVQGTVLTNDATLAFDTDGDGETDTSVSDDASVNVVEPLLLIDKELLSDNPLTLGGLAQYQITIRLDPASGADAYNVIIQDALPPFLSGVENVDIAVSGGSPTIINNSTANLLLLDISAIDSTTVITITVVARVTTDPAAVGQSTTNLVEGEYTSLDTPDGGDDSAIEREYETEDEVTAQIEAVDLFVDKDDGGITAVPGGDITYTINYGNSGNLPATGVVITESLPEYVTFEPAANPGWTLVGDTLTFNVGDLAAGETGSVTLVVTVINPLPAGVEQTDNTVSIDGDDSNGTDPTPENNTDEDVTPLEAAPDYVIDKIELFDDPAAPGETISWDIVVTNEGNQDGTGVVVTDTLPTGDFFDVGFIASDGGIVDLDAGTVTWNIGNLAAGESITLTLTTTVNENVPPVLLPTQVNSVSVTDDGANGPDPTPENNSDSEPFDITLVDLVINKDDGDITTTPGGSITYTLSYANIGGFPAEDTFITETLPDNVTFDAANSDPRWVEQGDGTIRLDLGTLAPGDNGSVAFTVIVNNPLPAGVEEISNTSEIDYGGGNGPDQNITNNTDNDTTPVIAQPDYVIDKIENFDDPANPGDAIGWTIVVTNEGNQDGTGVVVTDTLPDTSLFNSFTASDGGVIDLAAGTVTWNIGDLAVGETITLTLSAVVNDTVPETVPTQTNTVTVTDDGTNGEDPTPDNNTDSEDLDITYVDYVVDKIEQFTDPTHPGAPISWTIDVSNQGTQDGTGVVVTDTLPDTSLFTGFTASNGGVIDLAAGTVTWNIGNLAAGESVTLTLSAVVVESVPANVGPQVNSVVVEDDGANGLDRVPENNSDEEVFTIEFVDLFIDKDDNGAVPRPTDTLVYTIDFGNRGTATATGVVITETLPPNTSFDAANSSPGWVQNGDTFTFDVGTLAPGEQGSITFAVTINYPLEATILQTNNTATITDDGGSGPDQNLLDNIDSDETEIANDFNVDNITLSHLHGDYIYPPREWERRAPELHGRLISKETENVTANLQGGRNGGNFDPAFGTIDGNRFPNDWSRVFRNDLSVESGTGNDAEKSSPLEMHKDFGRYRANSLFGEFERPAASPELPSTPDFAPIAEPLPSPFRSEPIDLHPERSQLQQQLDEIARELSEAHVSPLLAALAALSAEEHAQKQTQPAHRGMN